METLLLQLILLIVRLTGFVVFFPVLQDGRMPRLVKVGFALSLTWFFVADGGHPTTGLLADAAEVGWLRLMVAAAAEVMFGAGLGFIFGILIEPARIAGGYIGQELGLTLAAATDPGSRLNSNVVTQIVEAWAILLFFLSNTHHVVLLVIRASLEAFPLGSGWFRFPAGAMAYQTDLAAKWGLLIASPVGLVMFLSLVFLAVLMRAVPQMNIFAIGLSLRLGVGLVAMLIFLPAMLEMLSRVLAHAPQILDALF